MTTFIITNFAILIHLSNVAHLHGPGDMKLRWKRCRRKKIGWPPRRRPGRCVPSRLRAGEPAVLRRGPGLERSAAGARGGGTPRCHAAPPGGPRRAGPRLRCVAPPLPELPGAARRAAAGPGGPPHRAERGGGAAIPGEVRLLRLVLSLTGYLDWNSWQFFSGKCGWVMMGFCANLANS